MIAIGPRKSARAASLKNATRHERTIVLPAKPDLDAREWGRACPARKYNRISSIFKSSFFWRRQSRLEVEAGRRRERRRGPARMKISPFLGIAGSGAFGSRILPMISLLKGRTSLYEPAFARDPGKRGLAGEINSPGPWHSIRLRYTLLIVYRWLISGRSNVRR